jgi:hypothetical protein
MMLRAGLKTTPACGQSANMRAEPPPSYNGHDAPWRSALEQRVYDRWPESQGRIPDRTISTARRKERKDHRAGRLQTLGACPPCYTPSSSGARSPRPDQVARQSAQRGGSARGPDRLATIRFPPCAICRRYRESPGGARSVQRPVLAPRLSSEGAINVGRFASDCQRARPCRRHSADRSAAQSTDRMPCYLRKSRLSARGGKDVTSADVYQVTLARRRS